jgi:hypothetical protein
MSTNFIGCKLQPSLTTQKFCFIYGMLDFCPIYFKPNVSLFLTHYKILLLDGGEGEPCEIFSNGSESPTQCAAMIQALYYSVFGGDANLWQIGSLGGIACHGIVLPHGGNGMAGHAPFTGGGPQTTVLASDMVCLRGLPVSHLLPWCLSEVNPTLPYGKPYGRNWRRCAGEVIYKRGWSSHLPHFSLYLREKMMLESIYTGTSSGLNDCLWVPWPWFWLPTIEQHLEATVPGTYMADIDVSKQFLNFILHHSVRPHAGVDLTAFLLEELADTSGAPQTRRTLWVHWTAGVGWVLSPLLTSLGKACYMQRNGYGGPKGSI